MHELICSTAYELLDDDAKRMVDEIMSRSNLASEFNDIASGCIWADNVRRTTHPDTYEYHYINVPESEQFDNKQDCTAHDRVIQAIQRYALSINNPNVKTRDKKEALLFLGHFVGDLHQPLHVGNVEDKGGNTITVFTFLTDRTANTTLHGVWDSKVGKKAKLHYGNAKQTLITKIGQLDTTSWETTNPVAWAQESFDHARNSAYQLPDGTIVVNGTHLTDAYYDKAKFIIVEQVMKAAVRLAHLIELAKKNQLDYTRFLE